jgi:hypothetical protein
MYVDIIILSILNGLTSGPLAIQRLKALHRLGLASGCFESFYGEQHLLALSFIQGFVSFCNLVAQGMNPEETVIMNIMMSFAIAPLAFLLGMVFLMFQYFSHIIYRLLAT